MATREQKIMPKPFFAETEGNRPDLAYEIEHNPENKLEYLDRFELTTEDLKSTNHAYDKAAQLYSVLEWSKASIDRVWIDVFRGDLKDTIKALPFGSKVYVPGCGTGKDAYTLTLLNRRIKVIASDLSASMLKEGMLRFNWPQFVALTQAIYESGDYINGAGWISQISNYYFTSLNEEDGVPELERHLRDIVFTDISSRFSFIRGRLEEQVFPSESLDVIISLANLQHLPDDLLFSTLITYIDLLKPGGSLYFNLRLDLNPLTFEDPARNIKISLGRIFRDNILKEWRYYNTLSDREIRSLERKLLKIFGEQISITVQEQISRHPQEAKPSFVNVRIFKRF